MKKLILFTTLIFCAVLSKGQTIDTSIHNCRSAKVVHFKNNPLLDTGYVTHVGITTALADYTSAIPFITLTYVFINDASKIISSNNIILSGADYAAWYNTVDKVNYFFWYIRTHVLDSTGSIFITYQ